MIQSLPEARTIVDVGCGEGYVLDRISKIRIFERLVGVDKSEELTRKASGLYPSLAFSKASAYSLPYNSGEFDLALACEVLEHLEDYEKAIIELKRISNKFIIITVPLEPLWRVFNMVRTSYITSLGNTPGHLQHWNRKGFSRMLTRYFTVEKILYPLPWQIALCRKG